MRADTSGLRALPEAGMDQEAKHVSSFYEPLLWPSTPPADIPFPQSDLLRGIRFTGRHKEYTEDTDADTWFPTWAQDGDLYSPFEDGSVNAPGGGKIEADGAQGKKANQGSAKIIGSDIVLVSSPVATKVIEFMQNKNEWTGTTGELLKKLNIQISDEPRGRARPITPRALSSTLARLKPNLKNAGIKIHRLPREADRRPIRLEKRPTAEPQPFQSP